MKIIHLNHNRGRKPGKHEEETEEAGAHMREEKAYVGYSSVPSLFYSFEPPTTTKNISFKKIIT